VAGAPPRSPPAHTEETRENPHETPTGTACTDLDERDKQTRLRKRLNRLAWSGPLGTALAQTIEDAIRFRLLGDEKAGRWDRPPGRAWPRGDVAALALGGYRPASRCAVAGLLQNLLSWADRRLWTAAHYRLSFADCGGEQRLLHNERSQRRGGWRQEPAAGIENTADRPGHISRYRSRPAGYSPLSIGFHAPGQVSEPLRADAGRRFAAAGSPAVRPGSDALFEVRIRPGRLGIAALREGDNGPAGCRPQAYVNVPPCGIAQERGFRGSGPLTWPPPKEDLRAPQTQVRAVWCRVERTREMLGGGADTSRLKRTTREASRTRPAGVPTISVYLGGALIDRPTLVDERALTRHTRSKTCAGGRIGPTSSLTEGTGRRSRSGHTPARPAHGLTGPGRLDFALEGSHVERWMERRAAGPGSDRRGVAG